MAWSTGRRSLAAMGVAAVAMTACGGTAAPTVVSDRSGTTARPQEPGSPAATTTASDPSGKPDQPGKPGKESKSKPPKPGKVDPSAPLTPEPAWAGQPTGKQDGPPKDCANPGSPTVRTADELSKALAGAKPGDRIVLADGTYQGRFVMKNSGTPQAPVALCGGRGAVLDAGGDGYVVHLDGASHWVLAGFTVTNGQKGIIGDGTQHSTFADLEISNTGDEALHLRKHSSDNRIIGNRIHDTGRRQPKFGEGIYIGSAQSNWPKISDGQPDRSDRNRILGNTIWATSSESIDIKEGTVDGLVKGNRLSGAGQKGADSAVDVKGNWWTVTGNWVEHPALDGIQTHQVVKDWGADNTFTANRGVLDKDDGFLIAPRPEANNRVACDNLLASGPGKPSLVPCR